MGNTNVVKTKHDIVCIHITTNHQHGKHYIVNIYNNNACLYCIYMYMYNVYDTYRIYILSSCGYYLFRTLRSCGYISTAGTIILSRYIRTHIATAVILSIFNNLAYLLLQNVFSYGYKPRRVLNDSEFRVCMCV